MIALVLLMTFEGNFGSLLSDEKVASILHWLEADTDSIGRFKSAKQENKKTREQEITH